MQKQPHLKKRQEDDVLVWASQKEPDRFVFLYERYRPTVAAYFRARVQDQDMAEDLTEETFVRAFSHLSEYRTGQALYRTYLLRIAHNLYVSFLRQYHETTSLEQVIDRLRTPEKIEPTIASTEALQQALAVLSEIDARIIREKYMDGFSIREIAHHVGMTENAVKLRLSRARKKVSALLVQ